MCGICGVWGNDSIKPVEAMVSAMHHRGPDDHGCFIDDHVALGMSRLAIIDTSASGHQPMANADQTVWIVYNGETYNFRTERALLERKGHAFSSTSDTEVILRMYEEYGDDFLLRMRGMFALGIYDKRRGPGRERLVLARDPIGIKPLLYAQLGSQLVFASELKALLASGLVDPHVDPMALRMLLTYGSVQQPRTMLRGVQMLLPGHRLILEHGQVKLDRYWVLGLDRKPGLRGQPYETLVSELSSALQDAVRMHLVSDVPLGAFLSGGVDSSVLVALMAQMAGRRVKTFSVGFEKEGAGIDESGKAERIARFLGTSHTHVLVRGAEVRDRIGHIAYSLDQPSVDGVNSYFVSWAARQSVTVALSGTGGDELFAGYPWFIQMVLDRDRDERQPWRAIASRLLGTVARESALDRFVGLRGGGGLDRLRSRASFVARYANLYQIFGSAGAARVLAPGLRREAGGGRAPERDYEGLDELSDGSAIERVTALCLRGYTNNQLLRDIDAVSMAHSLEVRVPYLDTEVVNLALSLPDMAKLGLLEGVPAPERRTYRATGAKRILVDAGRPFLPGGLDLQPKSGFGMPFDTWLRGPLRDVLLDTLSDAAVRRRGWLDPRQVAATRLAFLEGRGISWAPPWLLMMLELWCREVLDPSPQAHVHGFSEESGA